jgi:DNA-binding transcriptional LysR family regulator
MSGWEGFEEVVAVADAGTFTRGAEILGVSTSHISKMVARLEDRLDAQIFTRTTRRVSLTDMGRAFVDQCRRIIQERDELLSQIHGSGEPQGYLRITCSIAMGENFIAPIARQFALDNPRISLTLDLTNRVVDIVGEGYDIAIRTGGIGDVRLVGRQIALRAIEVCAAPSYLRASGVPKLIADLENHDCLIGTSRTWQFQQHGAPHIFTPHGRWRCNSGTAVVEAAIGGMGICQLPEFYVRTHVQEGRLVSILKPYKCKPEPVWVVYPQRRHIMPKIRSLVDVLEKKLQAALSLSSISNEPVAT